MSAVIRSLGGPNLVVPFNPIISNLIALASVTVVQANFVRIGNNPVEVILVADLTNDGSGNPMFFDMALPVPTNLINADDLKGIVGNIGSVNLATDNVTLLAFFTGVLTTRYQWSFQYIIQP